MSADIKDEVESKITRELVPEAARPDFLPDRVGPEHMLTFEFAVYDLMSASCASYGGGHWEFYTLSNGGWYMAPGDFPDGKATVACNSNYYEGEMSADAAAIAVCLTILNHLLWNLHGAGAEWSAVGDGFERLRAYAAEHDEAGEIFGFID